MNSLLFWGIFHWKKLALVAAIVAIAVSLTILLSGCARVCYMPSMNGDALFIKRHLGSVKAYHFEGGYSNYGCYTLAKEEKTEEGTIYEYRRLHKDEDLPCVQPSDLGIDENCEMCGREDLK